MTQYDEVKEFIRRNPGTTRGMLREKMPRITHEVEILTRLLESGDGYREKVEGKTKRGCWGYFLNGECE